MPCTEIRGLLRARAGTGADFFIFPGEGYNPIMLSHQKRKLSEDLKWFDKYWRSNTAHPLGLVS